MNRDDAIGRIKTLIAQRKELIEYYDQQIDYNMAERHSSVGSLESRINRLKTEHNISDEEIQK